MITFFLSVFTALAHLLLSWSLEQAMITTEKKNVQEKKNEWDFIASDDLVITIKIFFLLWEPWFRVLRGTGSSRS